MRHRKRLLIIGQGFRSNEIGKGIQSYCRLHGNWDFHWEADSGLTLVSRITLAIRKWKADGIIAHIRNDVVENLVLNTKLPVINVSAARNLELPTVISDDLAIGRMGARHFLDGGYRNFGYAAITIEAFAQKRCDGFVGELAAAGYGCSIFSDEFVGTEETDWVRNLRRMDRWLMSLPKPAGVMCMYDIRGQEVAMACQRLGLRVPDDIAIVGAENEELVCTMCSPPLSSVQTDLPKIGYEAVRILDRILRGQKVPSRPVMIAPRNIVIRQSSNIVAIDDPHISAVVRLIRERGQEALRVKELLQHVPISRRMLEIRFSKILGRTPGAEILRVRMERIKSLLTQTDLAMPAIARKTGFSRADIFSTFFRRKTGLTPTEFRRRGRVER